MKYFKLFSKESFFSTQNLHYYYKNKHFFMTNFWIISEEH